MDGYIITIPDYLPQRLNVLLRSHWAVRGRAQKEADHLVCAYGMLSRVPKATTRRRVRLIFFGARSDPDSRMKLLLDALVHAGLLVDDSGKWCELATPRNEKGPKATRIILVNVD